VLPIAARSPRRFGDAVGHDGSWSPDGRTIVWANGLDLYVSNSDGTGSRKFLGTNAVGATRANGPTWSPDGKHLRFVLWTSYDFHAIWEVSPDATGLHPLLPGWDNPSSHSFTSWTPDGRHFLFTTHKGLTSENVWAIREDVGIVRKAGEPVQLTSGPTNFYFPFASRDGKKIFVHGVEARGELVRYEARSRQFVPYLGGISAELPSFSKDGQWIAYTKLPDEDLWRSKVDGSQQLQLTFSPLQAGMPRWSPDGRYIAAMPLPAVESKDPSKVVLFDFTTQEWVDLANIGTGYTNCSRDGKYVYLQSHDDPGIFRVRISDRKLERVVSLKDVPRIGPIEDGFSLAPDDSPLILRDASVEQLYALDWEAP